MQYTMQRKIPKQQLLVENFLRTTMIGLNAHMTMAIFTSYITILLRLFREKHFKYLKSYLFS